ncbi:unnamed protein product [Citrullus colocynthis]|uniref:Uncharacterized protein n=1 Tax=Citrullus colocynthis TaxID=252529 RepID=A0ABP0XLY3_9ROSI
MFLHENVSIFVPAGGRARSRARANAMTGNKVSAQNQMDVLLEVAPSLWITRPYLVVGYSAILPHEFVTQTKDRSLIASCCQEQVLNHPSVAGFLTHNGWNSTMESICAGVAMISWPSFAEQQTNCRYCCAEWGIAMANDNDVKRMKLRSL